MWVSQKELENEEALELIYKLNSIRQIKDRELEESNINTNGEIKSNNETTNKNVIINTY